MKWMGHVAYMDEKKNAYRVVVGIPVCKRLHGGPMLRW
jgi:hypothetical protein